MDLFALWDSFLTCLEREDGQYYDMFLTKVFPISLSGNVLTVSPNQPYLVRWIENVYKKKMEEILSAQSGMPIRVRILAPGEKPAAEAMPAPQPKAVSEPSEPVPDETAPFAAERPTVPYEETLPLPETDDISGEMQPPDFSDLQARSASEVTLPDINDYYAAGDDGPLHATSLFDKPERKEGPRFSSTPVNQTYTFETFVHGNCNEIAYQAAYSMARAVVDPKLEPTNTNPLFIYGPSGLGKTHLLHAICNYIAQNKPNLKVLFVSSETFTNELIDAIQNHTMPKFRAKYRTLDCLLIDDVQFFGSRESTKMEIFNTFNELFDKKKNIVLTSDRTPSDIEKLEARLQSRFSSGLVAPIMPPDYEICTIILQKRAEKMNLHIPKDVVDYIAGHIQTNVRELEGAFNKLVTFAHIRKQPITLEFAKDALRDQIPPEDEQTLSPEDIIEAVCRYYGVRKEKVLGNSRPQNIVVPRQMAMYLCRTELNESFPAIRDAFRRKDHTTVLHACERVQKSLDKDPQTRAALEAIKKQLKNR